MCDLLLSSNSSKQSSQLACCTIYKHDWGTLLAWTSLEPQQQLIDHLQRSEILPLIATRTKVCLSMNNSINPWILKWLAAVPRKKKQTNSIQKRLIWRKMDMWLWGFEDRGWIGGIEQFSARDLWFVEDTDSCSILVNVRPMYYRKEQGKGNEQFIDLTIASNEKHTMRKRP